VLSGIVPPHYDGLKLAAMDGWDLADERGEPWPFANLTLPQDIVLKSHLQAFMRAKEIELRRCAGDKRRLLSARPLQAWATPPPRPRFKSRIELTAGED